MPEEYKRNLHRRLQSVYGALSKTTFLADIFDQEWYERISDEINKADLSRPFQCDSALMFFQLDHPLRGQDWFEQAQTFVELGRANELGENQKLALGLFGMDPLRTLVPILEERLESFNALPYKQEEVSRKVNELRANRFEPDFRNHVFEICVLGFFAKEGVLTDIEVLTGSSTVDGEINVDGRPILIEVTFTSQELLPPGSGIYWVDVEQFVGQVVHKIRKKAADGRQLALARGIPSLLFLGRNRLGADELTAKWGIKECFADPEFAKLSGVIVSDSWRLIATEFYVAPSPEVPFSANETRILTGWFQSR